MAFNPEKFRGELAGDLSNTPKENRKEKIEKAKESKEYWRAREEIIGGRHEGVESVDDGLGLLIKQKMLYHGSNSTGIEKLRPSTDNSTVGDGIYLTNAPRAIDYSQGRSNKQSVIYEVKIENVKIAELRTRENLNKVMQNFRPVLEKQLERSDVPSWYPEYVREAIRAIDRGITVDNIQKVTNQFSKLFSAYLSGKGYDGLVTIEGGEVGHLENHESWVMFDPEKVKIMREHGISKNDDSKNQTPS